MQKPIPHHKLIYGASIENLKKVNKQVSVIAPFQKYTAPMNSNDTVEFIGFEYGRVCGLYDSLHYSYENELQLCAESVPDSIIGSFADYYPGVTGKSYAIIQDVYTSHYVWGTIMYGYWITTNNKKVTGELCDLELDKKWKNVEIKLPGHNMKDLPGDLFIGKSLGELSQCEDNDVRDYYKLAKQICKTYMIDNETNLPSRNTILKRLHKVNSKIDISIIPQIALIQNMCYCCT